LTKEDDTAILQFPLELDDRINWLQKALACLEEARLTKDVLSKEVIGKVNEVEQALKVLSFQKLLKAKLLTNFI